MEEEGGRDDEEEVEEDAGQQEEHRRDHEADVDQDDTSDGRSLGTVEGEQVEQKARDTGHQAMARAFTALTVTRADG